MKPRTIQTHRYSLTPKSGGRARAGALLRVTFEDESIGVSDLHPWPEFGDPELPVLVENLRRGDPDRISTLALRAAADEASALRTGRPLVDGSIENHRLVTFAGDWTSGDWLDARRDGFRAVKVKIARKGDESLEDEAMHLAQGVSHFGDLRLRLDANQRASRDGLLRFLDRLPLSLRQAIEYVEDPTPVRDGTEWATLASETGVAIAIDMPLTHLSRKEWKERHAKGAFQYFVHKPAWLDEKEAVAAIDDGIKVVVTSTLGHVVGEIWAASRAAQLAPNEVHGCLSHLVYRDDDATRALNGSKQMRGCRLFGAEPGLGLDGRWWQRLKWEELA